jgi:sepiapterin reductase
MADSTTASSDGSGLVIISGASRGIGRAIALAIADAACRANRDNNSSVSKLIAPRLHMVLISRSASSLQDTASMIKQRCDNDNLDTIKTTCYEKMDLADIDSLPNNVDKILQPLSSSSNENYNSCLLINNAGSLGPLGRVTDICNDDSASASLKRWKETIDFNITSSMWISSQFAKAASHVPLVRIVNISSLCAIDPFPTMALYCAGKAARDMFHAVLAKEQKIKADDEEETDQSHHQTSNSVQFKVLNYAPGACDTAMTDTLADCADLDSELHTFFNTSRDEKKLIRPEDTAAKLVGLLEKDEFESGSHVDYWDI